MAKLANHTAAAAEPHEASVVRAAPAPRPQVPTSQRFLYCYKPERVTVLHGKVVPNLAKLIIEPGVNCVGPNKDISVAILERQKKGWRIIPEDIDGATYLAKRTNHRGKPFWLDRFAKVYNGSSHIGDGSEDYAEWLSGLMAKGLIESPPEYVVETLLAELQAAVTRLEDRDNRSELSELRKLEANAKACEDFLNPPKPKRKAKGAM